MPLELLNAGKIRALAAPSPPSVAADNYRPLPNETTTITISQKSEVRSNTDTNVNSNARFTQTYMHGPTYLYKLTSVGAPLT